MLALDVQTGPFETITRRGTVSIRIKGPRRTTPLSVLFAMSLNATVAVESLYADTDLQSLNWVEQQWVAWYVWIGNPVIATGLMSFLMHEIVYFGRCIPWIIIDAIPYFRRWKLQPTKIPSVQDQWECTKLVLFSHFTIELPQIWLFHPLAESIGNVHLSSPVPFSKDDVTSNSILLLLRRSMALWGVSFTSISIRSIIGMLRPSVLPQSTRTPAEVMCLGMGTLAGPLLYCAFTRDFHIMTMYIWITLRLFQAVDSHSGYGVLPVGKSLLPLVPPAHSYHFGRVLNTTDFHHMTFTNNFSSSFPRLRAAKYANKNATEEERLAYERKVMAQVEAEGLAAEAALENSVGKGKQD
ncbi:uncharacterized protein EV420DRAFT_1762091 [Desarmillaria tabescens]|uniref:Uncharacterized protein n=1 Tax=Armillaria tabescens TaxID=1929756 RepID=A0AA39TPH4_ARMTA|nr:uncharacterized protein EV420DRAFT_1762091 [Desarmillaria tabescens]KAK0461923.1 hypothetical protein EV420DRAFT_1762091 [Desarmillaria tabescens]